MVQHLPDDVWSQIAEAWSDRGTLHSVSLTSRRMHRLVVPVLFRNLEFDIIRADSEFLMVRLIRNTVRAQFLFNYPELLRHTRCFSLWEYSYIVDSIAECFALHEDSDSSASRRDAENLLAVLYDAIYRLIFRMPGLREIQIGNSAMTPLCYAAISSCPLLTSLTLEPMRVPDITHVPPAFPYARHLRDFSYSHGLTDNASPSDPYLAELLDRCMLDLEWLATSSILLPIVASHILLHHMLSLRSLSVRFSYDPEASDGQVAVAALLQILRVCPQLQHLDLRGKFSDVEPTHYLPSINLPNLSTFFGTSFLLQKLSRGTNLIEIDIRDNINIQEQSLTQVIQSPPMHLRELCIWQVVFSMQTPHDFLTFIRSLSVFQNLESLDIAYQLDIPWRDHASAQDLQSLIKDLVDQLACLRSLNIHSWYDILKGYDVGCPISEPGEPDDRGHPSLEDIHVDFICGMWSWDSRTGWEEIDHVSRYLESVSQSSLDSLTSTGGEGAGGT